LGIASTMYTARETVAYLHDDLAPPCNDEVDKFFILGDDHQTTDQDEFIPATADHSNLCWQSKFTDIEYDDTYEFDEVAALERDVHHLKQLLGRAYLTIWYLRALGMISVLFTIIAVLQE
jgi:hypothetical protein